MDLLSCFMPTARIYCKAGHNFSLAIRGGKVVLALANPADEYQHWYVDVFFSGNGLALVNKKTGEVIKRTSSNQGPVRIR
ncbi:hypothetical protein SLEP1_g19288 [Rubroshorea leprosula]|nr:hypothetical protein SLEP1_g19288 [Rubroshorea leprosula]